MDTDRRAGKNTLAVKLGREQARTVFAAMVYGAFVIAPVPWILGELGPWLLLCWLALPLAVPLVGFVRQHTDGPSLNQALARTAMVQLVFCVLLSVGVMAS